MKNIQSIIDKANRYIIGEEEIKRVNEVLRTGFLSKPDGGPAVEEFQKEMGKTHNQKYAFALTSGTASLHAAIVALELKSGDEVIVPALANIADCSVVIQEGARPVFADIDPNDFNIDPKEIERKITDRTKAVIVVHMFGEPGRIDEIQNLCKKHNLVLIEDCAQAAGARYRSKYVGSFGDMSCYSLYQTKHIVCGEGGVVLTSNDQYASIITSVTNNGIIKKDLDAYDYDRIGYNYQITDIQAAIATVQLHKLDDRNKERRANVALYKELLKDLNITFQKENDDSENVYFYLTGLLPESMNGKRDEFMKLVKEQGSPIKKLYPLALPETTLLKNDFPQECPVAQTLSKRLFNLYVNPGLERDDIEFMATAVRKAYDQFM